MAERFSASRRESAFAIALAAALFVIYARGACPTIFVGDSGDLVTAVYLLGIPHPSGYPLYVLVGKLWTLLLPLGSIAYRMSLFSAVCAAASCGVLYWLCRRLDLCQVAALLAALLLAFAPSFWGEANIQRVYALNALFTMVATATAWRWYRSGRSRDLALAYALVHQYRSNVAFLMGDRERAVTALRQALTLEPDNALYQSNLRRLEATPRQ
jgi:uncharacterized membrane protein